MKNLTKSLFVLALVVLMPLSSFAAYVTISYTSNGTTHYLAAAATGNGVIDKTTVDAYCLWEISSTSATENITFKNYERNKYLIYSSSDNSASLALADQDNSKWKKNNDKKYYYFTYVGGKKTTYYKGIRYNRNQWVMSDSKDNIKNSNMTALTITVYDGPYTQTADNSTTTTLNSVSFTTTSNQTIPNEGGSVTVKIQANVKVSTKNQSAGTYYLPSGTADTDANKNKRLYVEGALPAAPEERTIIDATTLSAAPYNMTPVVTINDTQTFSGSIDNFSVSSPVLSSDGKTWEVTITANTNSPIKDKPAQASQMKDLLSRLSASITYDGTTKNTTNLQISQPVYYQSVIDSLYVTIDESVNSLYPYTGGTKTYTVRAFHMYGNLLSDSENRPISDVTGITTELAVNLRSASVVSIDVIPVDLITGEKAWADTVSVSGNQITIVTDTNKTLRTRTSRLVVALNHRCSEGNVTHIAQGEALINQASQNSSSTGKMLYHQKGVTGSPLDSKGRQQVHQVEHTIYTFDNQEAKFTLKQASFRGWVRWYEYNTDNDLYEGGYILGWSTAPNGSVIGDGTTSQGRYGNNLNSNLTSPVAEKFVMSKVPCDVAVDVSNYTDYKITADSIVEPTLSFREIWHVRPASEMATKMELSKTDDDYYLEDYEVVAPTGVDINLPTKFRYVGATDRNGNITTHESEFNYIYLDGSDYKRVGYTDCLSASWSIISDFENFDLGDVTPSTSMVQVSAPNEGTAEIKLTAGDYKICRYKITFKTDTIVGPVKESNGRAIITDAKILSDYTVLAKLDFNDVDNTPGTTSAVKSRNPLPWAECAAGYAYPSSVSPTHKRQGNVGNFAYFGEYILMNKVGRSDNSALYNVEQRGGAENGYLIFMDGSQQPGLVASLSVNAKLCSGQKMYCSAWINNNGNPGNELPQFQFVVEGKKHSATEWAEISNFFTGKVPGRTNADPNNTSPWQQVVFEIDLHKDDEFDDYRISIYNYANSTAGNDFCIDDITIFSSRPPLIAYQASSSCSAEQTDVPIVLRLDYDGLPDDNWAKKHIYYEVLNTTINDTVAVKPYFLGNETDSTAKFGFVYVPEKNFNPKDSFPVYDPDGAGNFVNNDSLRSYITKNGMPKAVIYPNFAQFLNCFQNVSDSLCKGFIKETMGGVSRYVMYIIHTADMKAKYNYEVRMAGSNAEFGSAECALKTELPVADKITLELNGSPQITTEPLDLCANNMYEVAMHVYDISFDVVTGDSTIINGRCYNDWLVGAYQPDSCKKVFGYTFMEIQTALGALRYYSNDNPNMNVTNVTDIVKASDDEHSRLRDEDYLLISDLVNKGQLLLFLDEQTIFMPAGAPDVKYIIFPVMGTAYNYADGKPMSMCSDPVYVHLAIGAVGNSQFGIGKVNPADLPAALKNKPTVVRASQETARTGIRIPLQTVQNAASGDTIKVISSNDPGFTANKWFAYMPDRHFNKVGGTNEYYKVLDTIAFTPYATAPAGFTKYEPKQGYEYTFDMPLMTQTGLDTLGSGCPVGDVLFTVYVVPDEVVWDPSLNEDNNWNNDANWHMVDPETGEIVNDGIRKGYVPMGHTDIIIADAGDNSSYPELVPYSYLESSTDDKDRDLVTYDINYEATHCKNIRFEKNAMLLNQHLLRYEKAYVDVVLPGAYWTLVSSPIEGVVSGDMFTPQPVSGATPDDTWELTTYDQSGGRRFWQDPYCYWMSIYDESTNIYNMSSTQDNTIVYNTSYTQSGWSELANDVNHKFVAGDAVAILGFGPGDEYGYDCNVRLPKRDTQYGYFDNNGNPYGSSTTIDRPANYNKGNLIFHGNTEETFTLTNQTAGKFFIFGNPTMSYIDMTKFFARNTNFETTFRTLYQNGWAAVDCTNERTTGSGDNTYYLEPLRGVMLEYKHDPTTTVTVTLDTTMLTLAGYGHKASTSTESGGASYAPKRLMEVSLASCLHIIAETEDATSMLAIWEDPKGSDAYVAGEDADLMMSGITDYSDDNVNTPLAIYSIADDHMLSIDVRNKITTIPLAFVDLYEEGLVDVWFNGVETFDYPLYLVDVVADTKTRIINGLVLHLEMPQDGSIRYYLQGETHNTPDGPATSIQTVSAGDNDGNKVDFISYRPGQVTVVSESNISSVECFDLAGRLIRTVATATGSKNLVNINLPQGVALVRVNNEKGSVTGKLLIK